jgi:dephospho-CoA kinase
MNPPTTGHEKLVSKVHEIADKHKAGHSVVLSHSNDPEKNPLTADQKVKHAKRFFPNTNISTASKAEPNFLHHVAKLHKAGVTHLHVIAGSDRVPEYKKVLGKYNGKHEGALFNFKKVHVHSAGERDPDAHGTEGMSASKMRAHASSGNFKEFRKGVPKHVKDSHAHEMFNDVRHGMGLKEHLEEGKLYIPGNKGMPFPRGVMPQIKPHQLNAFRTHMAGLGIKSDHDVVPAHTLAATQAEFSPDKIKKLMSGDREQLKKPIMISKDNHVLDGHHRWLAGYNMDQDHAVNAIRFHAPIHDLISAAKKFSGVTYKGVNEDVNLQEGIHDPGIFKAIFMAGGPGSGKDFVLKRVTGNFGFVEVSSDPFLSHMMHQAKLDLKMPDHEEGQRNAVRSRAKQLEQHKKELVIRGRLGIIVNGVADDFNEVAAKKRDLEDLGYDTFMVFVSVSDDESKKRNIARGEMGGRTVPEHIRSNKWHGAIENMNRFMGLFGRNMVIVDNSVDINSSDQSSKHKLEADLQMAFKKIRAFVAVRPGSVQAATWIGMQQRGTGKHIPEELDEAFFTMLDEHSAGESGSYRATQSVHVVRRLGVRHGRGKTPGAQWAIHHRASNTATRDRTKPAPKPVKALRREAADAMPYDFDTTMGSTAPIGSNGGNIGAKGYNFGTRFEKVEVVHKKKKPLAKIIKESAEYIEEINQYRLHNIDDLLEGKE